MQTHSANCSWALNQHQCKAYRDRWYREGTEHTECLRCWRCGRASRLPAPNQHNEHNDPKRRRSFRHRSRMIHQRPAAPSLAGSARRATATSQVQGSVERLANAEQRQSATHRSVGCEGPSVAFHTLRLRVVALQHDASGGAGLALLCDKDPQSGRLNRSAKKTHERSAFHPAGRTGVCTAG